IDDVIARGMAKDPDERPASASELILEARRALGTLPAADTAPRRTSADPAGGVTATRRAPVVDPGMISAGSATRVGGVTPPAAPTRSSTPAAEPAPAVATGASRTPLIAVAVLAAVIAAAVGIVAGKKSTSKGVSASSFSSSASVGDLQLSFPTSWQRSATAPSIPGLTFAQPLALAPAGGSPSLAAGMVSAQGPTLLPASLLAKLPSTPTGTAVRIGSVEGLSYSGLSVAGVSGPLTLYVIPTSAGVATVACLAPGVPAPKASCEQVADTLRVSGATVYPLGASHSYAASLSRALTSLQSSRTGAQARLAGAKTVAAQARALSTLAGLYSSAAHAVSALSPSPQVADFNGRIVSALSGLAGDYTRAAAAVRHTSAGNYRAASRAIGSGSSTLTSAIAALTRAGYAVG
ncbi:MAG TPA: hypothetical protein VHX88_17165, partial [Solirubrobacteraceae bacterium]|nr:hypothetical protein [Solirubrobacteraceae bacterium]